MKSDVVSAIEREKIIAIVRGILPEKCMKVADALYAGGIRLLEITFDQREFISHQETANIISGIGQKYEGRMYIGAGTVTTRELVECAAKAGARFVISPDVNEDVIRRTVELGMVSIPGAMTPTEIMTAHRAGADFVKLFPAGELGIAYVKAVRAPISHVKLLAVGGIQEKNIPDFLRVGISGFGVGGNLVNKAWIDAGEYSKLTEAASDIITAVKGSCNAGMKEDDRL